MSNNFRKSRYTENASYVGIKVYVKTYNSEEHGVGLHGVCTVPYTRNDGRGENIQIL